MATTDQLVDQAKIVLSRRNDTAINATIITQLGLAQQKLEREAWLPSFLYTTQTITGITTTTVDLETSLTRYLGLDPESPSLNVLLASPVDGEQYAELRQFDDLSQLKQWYPGDVAAGGVVRGYWMRDSLVEFRPRPVAAAPQTVVVNFFQGEANLPAVGNSNQWTIKAGEWLLGTAGILIAQSLRDKEAERIFTAMASTDKARIYKADIARREAALSRSMGDPD